MGGLRVPALLQRDVLCELVWCAWSAGQGAELSVFLGEQVVEGDAALGLVRLHRLADVLDRLVEGGVGVCQAQLLLEPAVPHAGKLVGA